MGDSNLKGTQDLYAWDGGGRPVQQNQSDKQDLYKYDGGGDRGRQRPGCQDKQGDDSRICKWHPDYSYSSPEARQWLKENQASRREPIRLEKDGTYKVQHGDCLETIAERELRAEGKAVTKQSRDDEMKKIIELNRDRYRTLDCNSEYLGDGWRLRLRGDRTSSGDPNCPPEEGRRADVQRRRHEEVERPPVRPDLDPRYNPDQRYSPDPRYSMDPRYGPDQRYVDPRYNPDQRYVDPRYGPDQAYVDPRYSMDPRYDNYRRPNGIDALVGGLSQMLPLIFGGGNRYNRQPWCDYGSGYCEDDYYGRRQRWQPWQQQQNYWNNNNNWQDQRQLYWQNQPSYQNNNHGQYWLQHQLRQQQELNREQQMINQQRQRLQQEQEQQRQQQSIWRQQQEQQAALRHQQDALRHQQEQQQAWRQQQELRIQQQRQQEAQRQHQQQQQQQQQGRPQQNGQHQDWRREHHER